MQLSKLMVLCLQNYSSFFISLCPSRSPEERAQMETSTGCVRGSSVRIKGLGLVKLMPCRREEYGRERGT